MYKSNCSPQNAGLEALQLEAAMELEVRMDLQEPGGMLNLLTELRLQQVLQRFDSQVGWVVLKVTSNERPGHGDEKHCRVTLEGKSGNLLVLEETGQDLSSTLQRLLERLGPELELQFPAPQQKSC